MLLLGLPQKLMAAPLNVLHIEHLCLCQNVDFNQNKGLWSAQNGKASWRPIYSGYQRHWQCRKTVSSKIAEFSLSSYSSVSLKKNFIPRWLSHGTCSRCVCISNRNKLCEYAHQLHPFGKKESMQLQITLCIHEFERKQYCLELGVHFFTTNNYVIHTD